jgi:cyclopropane fatty-acyl-phospholipid synthase-like methyltransferase
MKYINALRTRPMAIETGKANEQHYEVGTGVLKACLGKKMKYSCCLYESKEGKELGGAMGDKDGGLDEAEERMLDDYVRKAGLVDGMSVLDLGYVYPSTHARASLYLDGKGGTTTITC